MGELVLWNLDVFGGENFMDLIKSSCVKGQAARNPTGEQSHGGNGGKKCRMKG